MREELEKRMGELSDVAEDQSSPYPRRTEALEKREILKTLYTAMYETN